MNAIELVNVSRSFGDHRAVDDLSLQVPQGVVYGFIGPNGSGKTTTIRMILRVYVPDQGRVVVLGTDCGEVADDRIGYLPEERGLYKKMRVGDVIRFFAELKGAGRGCRQEIVQWLERFALGEWIDKRVETLSKGMAQKVQFIAAVIARPRLLILDEPFSGLDPVNREVFKDAIVGLRRQGTTILFSTHDMGIAEQMCDSICMIHRGRKVLDGPLEQIQARYSEDTVRIRSSGQPIRFDDLPGVVSVNDFGRYQELRVERGTDTRALLYELLGRGPIEQFELGRPTLHDIFVRIAGVRPESMEAPIHA